MTAILSRLGGLRPHGRDTVLSQVIGRTMRRHPDLNHASFAALLGVSPSTEQNWREGASVPGVDYLRSVCRRSTVPDDFVLDLLQSLAGERALVTLVDRTTAAAPGSRDQAEALRAQAMELQRAALDVAEDVNAALVDRRIDGDERGMLSARGGLLSRLAGGFVTAVQRCAAGGRR